jgi:hypothetical protein
MSRLPALLPAGAVAVCILALTTPQAQAATSTVAASPRTPVTTSAPMSLAQFHRHARLDNTSAVTPAAICGSVYILANANGRYVSAELGYTGSNYGMLRARATAVGSWETYTDCYDGTYDTFRAANGRYVSAELGYTGSNYGMLRARATAVGPWERFVLGFASDGSYVIVAANGRYVSTELGYTGSNYAMLRARATAIGPWEVYF